MSQIIRKGVKSVSKSGSSELTGDITLSEGTGVTLTQSGQDIEIAASGGGSGDVTGPASSTDNAIARFDSTTGKLLQNAQYSSIDDNGKLTLSNPFGTLLTIEDGQVTASAGTDLGLASINGVRLDATGGSSGVRVTNDDLKTNNIDERSTGSGVTVDGVLLKDGNLTLSDSTSGVGNLTLDNGDAGTGVTLTADAVPGSSTITFPNVSGTAALTSSNITGSAASLTTSRTFRTNLASTSTASFNGTANVTPGVTGTLPVANGGTGVTTSTGTGSVVLSASPALTGDPTATTQTAGNSSTRIATTAFVGTAVTNERTASATLTNKDVSSSTNTFPATLFKTKGYQTDVSNSISNTTATAPFIQMGWGQVVGTGAANIQEAVTFPTAFSTLLGVTITPTAAKAGAGAATSLADFTSSFFTNNVSASAQDMSTTGFTVNLARQTGTYGTSTYYAYSWIAWGI